MKFVLSINCDTDAFIEDPDLEVASILEKLVLGLKDDGLETNPTLIKDSNGTVVGSAEFIDTIPLDS